MGEWEGVPPFWHMPKIPFGGERGGGLSLSRWHRVYTHRWCALSWEKINISNKTNTRSESEVQSTKQANCFISSVSADNKLMHENS